ncbi:MAG: glycerol-3-phosphate 1-O-acyltransferase PlsY [Candidatus Cloacimonetes bacterium]|nr:glycerol-3-phosphate 1-O-acyltransferase PlsY [Candidatus Cloacimonadota bacterium]
MQQIIAFSLILIIAYLLGSIPTSYLMGRILKKIDIRKFGSGNIGATNAFRVLGVKVGILTLIIDVAKGFFAIQLGKYILENPDDLFLIFIGLAVILGHICTIFLKFKGGKGVATSAGVFIALIPIPVFITLVVFILTVWISKYVSLGSLIAALTLFITELIININNSFAEIEILILIFIITVFIIIRHRENIKRILKGNENKIKFKK